MKATSRSLNGPESVAGDVTFEDVRAASRRLHGPAIRTPVLRNPSLDELAGMEVFIKPEPLQVSGSFKFRGAFNRISQLNNVERRRGVIAWSSGNHALGVATAAAQLGVPATIVMPRDAPRIKLERTRAMGAEVVTFDRYRDSREEIALRLQQERGGTIVPSYDDPHIIAGQGTVGMEFFEDVPVPLDAMLVCCGGGGLLAGAVVSQQTLSPDTHMFSVEPEGYDDHARSFESGKIESADTSKKSICDALLAPQPGNITFAINRRVVKRGLVVSEAEVRTAMRYAFRVLKLVVEPGGAVALAALLTGKVDDDIRRVGIVVSGGNVDPSFFAEVLGGQDTH